MPGTDEIRGTASFTADGGPGEADIQEVADLFRPHVAALIAPRIARDRSKFRSTPEEARELGDIFAGMMVAEGRGFSAAVRASRRIQHDMRNPPDLTPEEEAAVVDEFVNEESCGLAMLFLSALASARGASGDIVLPFGEDLLPEGFEVTEVSCRCFIYLEPDDVRHVLAAVRASTADLRTVPRSVRPAFGA